MFAIDDAKFPPPRPATHATATNVPNDVPGCTTAASSTDALKIVQLRPPNRAGPTVYGTLIAEPTALATATMRNLSAGDMPYFLSMNSTMTANSVHTENPICSAKIEKMRFRRATRRPVPSQNSGFSGSHRSIHRLVNMPISASRPLLELVWQDSRQPLLST